MDNSIGNQKTMGGKPPDDRSLGDSPTLRHGGSAPADDLSLGSVKTMRPGGAGPAGRRLAAGEVLLGRYRVEGELGQGGMGVVYRCHDEVAGLDVALKALPPEVGHNSGEMEEVRENFRLVSKLHHPNIANVNTLEKDPVTGDYYLVMECVDGYDVRQWVRRRREEGRPLTLDEVTIIAYRIAEALDFAHEQGVIHRDIKPSNVRVNFAGEVKVLDFGLAAQLHMSLSRVSQTTHGTSGTGPYMAPEQWQGRPQGAPADQYALAATVYELVGGSPPFEGHDTAVLREAVLKEAPRPLEGVPAHVNAALLRALAKEPGERFASCGEFVKALAGKGAGGQGERNWKVEVVRQGVESRESGVGRREPEGGGQKADGGGKRKAWLWVAAGAVAAVTAYGFAAFWNRHEIQARLAVKQTLDPPVNASEGRASARPASEQEETHKQEALAAESERLKVASAAVQKAGHNPGDTETLDLGGGVKIELAWCPAGSFMMGSPESETGRSKDETQHRVTLTKGFWMGKTEVTQRQWGAVMGTNPSNFKSADLPVEKVSWEDCQEFMRKLNAKLADAQTRVPPGGRFRLPTEAEWEYACRAGAVGSYAGALDMGWYSGNSGQVTHAVGQKQANAWGLYDMLGNVWEWCQDWYGDYPSGSVTDPAGPTSGSPRVARGGSWRGYAGDCRVADRGGRKPNHRDSRIGFRAVLLPGQ
ncbi:MAG: bifunctional serine/threonine-protein kinase/formylglycine-generating enzyme family protein [bacterium]